MKRLYPLAGFILIAALAASCSLADGEGLDIENAADSRAKGKTPANAIYMQNASSSGASTILLNDETGGTATVLPVLAAPASEDVTVTVSFDTSALEQYNTLNNLFYKAVDPSVVTFVTGEGNTSTGSATVTIPAGSTSAPVVLNIAALDPEVYSFAEKYAVPVRITSTTSEYPILSSPDFSIITLDRLFKTNVLHIIRMGGSSIIKMNAPMKEDVTEWTMQGQFHFSELGRNDPQVASPNQTVMNIGGGGITMGWWSRIQYESGIQIKRGRDGADMWTNKPLKDHEWLNITFVYREVSKTENKGRIEVYYGAELVKTFDETTTPAYSWRAGAPDPVWSWGFGNYRDDYVRELKMWDRALTTAEIQDKLYLPERPEADGLLFYYPLTRESFDETTGVFLDLTGNSTMTLPALFEFEFVDNVVLPNETIVVEE